VTEHTQDRPHIVFFSRGKGRGHAVPDAAIAEELLAREPDAKLTFVSYSVGAATLREFGWDVVDLDLPEDNLLWDAALRIFKVLAGTRPTLVVSHEEFSVVPLAKAFGIPVVFLTDWFPSQQDPRMQGLKFADQVVFMDDPGYYDEPEYVKGKTVYVGVVLRKLMLDQADAPQFRSRYGVSPDATLISVAPGGAQFHSEARAPLFDLVLKAFGRLDLPAKRLLWIASGQDYDGLSKRSQAHPEVKVIRPHSDFTSMLLASDLVITKGNRTPLFECQTLGIPTISLSFGLNSVDDYRVTRIPTNTALRARGIDESVLASYISKALARRRSGVPTSHLDASSGRLAAVDRLQVHLRYQRALRAMVDAPQTVDCSA